MKPSRRDLTFTCSRRRLLPALFQEMAVILGSFGGGQGCRLADLDGLSDDELARMRPVVNPDYKIFVHQGHVCGRFKGSKAVLKLFPMESAYLAVFNRFDGRHTLDQIGDHLSREMGWDGARAFAYARDLFLSLAHRLVCLPQNLPGVDG